MIIFLSYINLILILYFISIVIDDVYRKYIMANRYKITHSARPSTFI